MTLHELLDASIIWHPEMFIKILDNPTSNLKPESMMVRSAHAVLGNREVAWFGRDIIALRK